LLGSAATRVDNQIDSGPDVRRSRHSIGVSTYSFWQFRGDRPSIEACIDKAATMGFDGVEILHLQM
jgi:hypothetical protein